mmetsp:Transcript_29963/g.82230  ORF Transcript_29963/g.82230 Transcript_29963/m.82230 type:complete len:82 (+) Transcript_29963:1570-1815(+)
MALLEPASILSCNDTNCSKRIALHSKKRDKPVLLEDYSSVMFVDGVDELHKRKRVGVASEKSSHPVLVTMVGNMLDILLFC